MASGGQHSSSSTIAALTQQSGGSGLSNEPLFSLTVGVEFEFNLIYQTTEGPPNGICERFGENINERDYPLSELPFQPLHEHNERRFRQFVIRKLHDHGIPMNRMNEPQDTRRWTVQRDSSIKGHPTEIVALRFRCSGGQILHIRDEFALHDVGIELVSGILPWGGAADQSRSLAQIREALFSLNEHMFTYTNESCGFHVHVGNGDRGFDVRTIKNLLSLVAIAEDQINEIHPEERLDSDFCFLIRAAFHENFRRPTEKLRAIEGLNTIPEIISFVHSNRFDRPDPWTVVLDSEESRYAAYNFMNLVNTDGKLTVEFRQHQGNLNFEMTERWLLFVTSIVRLAYSTENPFAYLVKKVEDDEYGALELFDDLYLEYLRGYYQNHLHLHDRDEERFDPWEYEGPFLL